MRSSVDLPAPLAPIAGGPGLDTVYLWKHAKAAGNITVRLQAGTAVGQGKDTLDSIEGAYVDSDHADLLVGDAGPNVFFSGAGVDVERGLGGNDRFVAGPGDDRHLGGSGADTIDMSMTYQVVVSLISDTARSEQTGTDTLVDIENATGSDGDDVLTGDEGRNVLAGGAGQDVLRGLSGNDVLYGGSNSDVPDLVDSLAGGPGDDLLDGGAPGQRGDTRDELDYTSSDVAVTVDLSAGWATGEGAYGSSGSRT